MYIGSAGKMGRHLVLSGSSIRSRLFSATTPYHFGEDVFHYGPTTSAIPPAGYAHQIPLRDVEVTCFVISAPKAPTAFEHLLIQGFIDEFPHIGKPALVRFRLLAAVLVQLENLHVFDDALLVAERFARRVRFQGCLDSKHPAQVVKMGLVRGGFLRAHLRPFCFELRRGHVPFTLGRAAGCDAYSG